MRKVRFPRLLTGFMRSLLLHYEYLAILTNNKKGLEFHVGICKADAASGSMHGSSYEGGSLLPPTLTNPPPDNVWSGGQFLQTVSTSRRFFSFLFLPLDGKPELFQSLFL